MKATKLLNPKTGETQWHLNGAFLTDPVVIGLIEEACKKECKPLDRLVVPECLVKRTINVGYDSGRTLGSSTNTAGAAPNVVRPDQTFTVLGWYVNGIEIGAGESLGPYTSWLNQLTGWADFKNTNDTNESVSTASGLPFPTGRYSRLTTCDPNAIYGPIRLQRDDGEEWTVYPVRSISSVEYEYAYRYAKIDCDGVKTIVWCDSEGADLPEPPEDADCYVPCSYPFADYIYDAGAPECTETVRELCDVVDGVSVGEFTLVITDCDGSRTLERFTTASYLSAENPDDLTAYVLQGTSSNCLTLAPYEEPLVPCSDFEIATVYSIEGKTPGLINREYDTDSALLGQGDIDAVRDLVANYDYDANPPSVEGVVTTNAFLINDTNNSADVVDLQIREGWICVAEPFEMRFSAFAEGSIIMELGKCYGELEEVIALSKPGGLQYTNSILIPAGVHRVRITNVDNSGSNSAWTLQIREGLEFATRGTYLDDVVSTTMPLEVKKCVKVCKPSGDFIDLLTDESVNKADCYCDSIKCSSSLGVWSGC